MNIMFTSTNIEPVIENAFTQLTLRRNELKQAKRDLTDRKISVEEFNNAEKSINEFKWLVEQGVEYPLAMISHNIIYVDKENGLVFKMGNGSYHSPLKEDEMVMMRINASFCETYSADDGYYEMPYCLRNEKFFNSEKFNFLRCAWGEAMEKVFQPDFLITRK